MTDGGGSAETVKPPHAVSRQALRMSNRLRTGFILQGLLQGGALRLGGQALCFQFGLRLAARLARLDQFGPKR